VASLPVSIPSQLIELGPVDEYNFVVQPIVVGEGRRLLEGISLQELGLYIDSERRSKFVSAPSGFT
jgi:dihydrofolate reductase